MVQRSSLLVLDEAFDGLDKDSRAELQRVLEAVFEDKSKTLVTRKHWIFHGFTALMKRFANCCQVMIAHRVEDLTPVPTHALLLGQGPKGTACSAADFNWSGVLWSQLGDLRSFQGAGRWAEMKEPVSRFLQVRLRSGIGKCGAWSAQADRIAAASLASGSSQPSSRLATPEAGCPCSSVRKEAKRSQMMPPVITRIA